MALCRAVEHAGAGSVGRSVVNYTDTMQSGLVTQAWQGPSPEITVSQAVVNLAGRPSLISF